MNFLRQGFRKLSSDRQTDRQTRPKLYTTLLRWCTLSLCASKVSATTCFGCIELYSSAGRSPLPSARQHPSYGDCLEVKRE